MLRTRLNHLVSLVEWLNVPKWFLEYLTIWWNWRNDWTVFWVPICMVQLNVCSFHVTYAFTAESALYSCHNIKEIFARSRDVIWSLCDCNLSRTQNHSLSKRTLNHFEQLTKWYSCLLSTYLYRAIECMFLSCHVSVSEWVQTLLLPKRQGFLCSKQARILKLKWLELDSNPEKLSSETNTQPFGRTDLLFELCS